MLELIAFITVAFCCAIAYGRLGEWGELRRNFSCKDELVKGKKMRFYYKYSNDLIWNGWRYYYVHIEKDSIHMIPPLFYRFFMPKLKIKLNADGSSEGKGIIGFKVRTVYKLKNCSVLIAFLPM